MSNSLSPLQEPLRIRIRRSRRLFYYLLTTHSIALLATLHVAQDLPWMQLLAVLLLPAVFCYHYIAFCKSGFPNSVNSITIAGEQVILGMVDGSSQQGVLGTRHFVAPWLVVIAVLLPGKIVGRHIALFPDAVDCEQLFRRLRVQLRFCQRGKPRSSAV